MGLSLNLSKVSYDEVYKEESRLENELDKWREDNFHVKDDNHQVQWSYGGFSNFRTEIARLAGINLSSMQGFRGNVSWDDFDDESIGWHLTPFLFHSDCDGELSPEDSARILTGLRWLDRIKVTDDSDFEHLHRERFDGLVAMLADAVERNLWIQFG